VVLFLLLIAAVPTAAYFAIRWYAYDNWYVSAQKQEIVVKQGRPGGVLWFHPSVVDVTKTTTSQVLPTDLAQIRAGVQEPSLLAAKRYVTNLQSEYVSVQNAKRAEANSSTTTTTTVPGTAPTTPTTAATTAATAAATTASTATSTTAAATTATTATTAAPTTATTAAP
jgi:protein phosphatase